LQTYANIARFEDSEWQQFVGLFASALAFGAISARMSYYLDISLEQREKAGNFYGYVRDSKRGRFIILVSMMLIAVSHLLSRTLAYSLIAVSVGKAYAALAVVLEVSLFFLYKLLRQGFNYQGFGEFRGVLASCFMRFTMKIVTDFTSLKAARAPSVMGGKSFASSS
jgi:hypothetical protein